MKKEKLDYPCYFKKGSVFTAMLSQKHYIQVRMFTTLTRIEQGANVHEIEEAIQGNVITKDQFTAAYRQANERIEL